MKKAILTRFDSTNQGTFGKLETAGFSCFITERPWLDNKKQQSCIPTGLYQCQWHKSPKFGWVYKVLNVPNRSEILIHPGNYYWHSHGCLLPATRLGYMAGKKAGLASRPAFLKLNTFFNKESFLLEIKNADIHSSNSF